MITRQLYVWWALGLMSAVAAQYVPVSSANDDNDCALYLSGPGRSSAFDYNLNLLRGSFPYDGQHTCITYDAVNAAYIDARKRINVATPKGDWKTEDIASVGELMLDISISLARTYGLTYEDIEKGLPLIDTSKTLIREVCPPFLSHVECRAGKYRRFDGLCTNLRHPTWGATMTPFQRLIAPLYADGINAPRISVTGRDLPLARVVSRTMHPDDGFHDHAGTVMVIAWGQFMDHDYTLTGTPLDPFNRNDPEECCNRSPHEKHPYCNELRIPDDDYFYRLFNIKCIDFVRGFPSPRAGCRLGSRAQFNTLTGVLDGNTVYGVTEKFSRKLRSGYGGLLRMNPVFEEYGLKDLLPLKLDIPDEGCTRPNKSMYCFEAGEIRVNEQLVLTCMHTLMAREHNRVARGLAQVNPHWDDETLFQESRRIVIGEIQHITYNEFLPILLGKEVMEKFGLLLNKEGYWDGYDDNINPSVIDAFAAAAFRFGHSLLPTAVERWSKAHKFISSKRLSDLIRRPFDLYRAGIFDEYLMGLMNQVAQAMDDSITQEVTNHLFKKPGARFGMDLVSFNMQRGREFGLPGYMEFRKFCGLPGANTFQELFGSMTNDTIQKYESIFDHPSDVDLWSGGVSERPLPGSMLGPTFACVIATQFSYSRRGDRFWYELPNQPSSFTPEQLAEIKKARLSRIICDNTDIIDTVQVYPMVLPDHEINPRVPCRSGIIPSIDFTKWADYSGGQRSYHQPNPYAETIASFNTTQTDNATVTTTFNLTETTTNLTKTVNSTNITNTPLPTLDTTTTKVDSAKGQGKSDGHYKNALRKRRSLDTNNNATDTTETNTTDTHKTTSTIAPLLPSPTQENESLVEMNDSQAAAIMVNPVMGHLDSEANQIMVTTATTVPRDSRRDTSPQTFTPKTRYDKRYYRYPKFYTFDYDHNDKDSSGGENNEQVSHQALKQEVADEDKPSKVYNEGEFVPDDNGKTGSEGSPDDAKDNRRHPHETGVRGKKLYRNTYMGPSPRDKQVLVDSQRRVHFDSTDLGSDVFAGPGIDSYRYTNLLGAGDAKPTDESHDLNRDNSDECTGVGGAYSAVDDSQGNSKLIRRVCPTGDSSMERINDSKEQLQNDVEQQTVPNDLAADLKQQFEFIPLNYQHDQAEQLKQQITTPQNLTQSARIEQEQGDDEDDDQNNENETNQEDDEEESGDDNVEENDGENNEEENESSDDTNQEDKDDDEEDAEENNDENERSDDSNQEVADGDKENAAEDKYDHSEPTGFEFNFDDIKVRLENISLPDDVFGFKDSDFFKDFQQKHEAYFQHTAHYRQGDANDDDDEDEDDKDEDDKDDDDEETPPKDTTKKARRKYKQRRSYDFHPHFFAPVYYGHDDDHDDHEHLVPKYLDFDEKRYMRRARDRDAQKKPPPSPNTFEYYVQDPKLRGAIKEMLAVGKKTADEAGPADDPKYSYFWTLEYGQPNTKPKWKRSKAG